MFKKVIMLLQLFAHEAQDRYSKLVLAKLRTELVLKRRGCI